MAQRLEKLAERQIALYEEFEALMPEQYRNRPHTDDDFVGFSWRRASGQLHEAAHDALNDLVYIYAEKAKRAEKRARAAGASSPSVDLGDDSQQANAATLEAAELPGG
jgi:hypothetical protein